MCVDSVVLEQSSLVTTAQQHSLKHFLHAFPAILVFLLISQIIIWILCEHKNASQVSSILHTQQLLCNKTRFSCRHALPECTGVGGGGGEPGTDKNVNMILNVLTSSLCLRTGVQKLTIRRQQLPNTNISVYSRADIFNTT